MENGLWRKLLPCLILISLTGCATWNQNELPTASDSFCTTYQQLVQAQGDGTIDAKRAVRERIYANEKTYMCLCRDPGHKVCKPQGK